MINDPSTGTRLMVTEHHMLLTLFNDSVYTGVMVLVYDATGISRFFLSLPSIMARNSQVMQALRYGVMFGSMMELRRWLTLMGIPTDASTLVHTVVDMIRGLGSRS
jgi:hypothetical protein